MAKKINYNGYVERAKDGARLLFNFSGFKLIDGTILINDSQGYTIHEEESYFLIDYNNNPEGDIYVLTLKEAYDLLALYACEDVSENVLMKNIISLIAIV